jgi:hypothetical protein
MPFDFTLSTDAQSIKIQKGKSAELLVIVEPLGEGIHNVRLISDNVPEGMNVKLEQDFMGDRPPYSIPIEISVADNMILRTYSFDMIGESGTIHHSITVKVKVVKEDLR